jgi:tripartite-type tricarboxylate transporter receptor subunit TctC
MRLQQWCLASLVALAVALGAVQSAPAQSWPARPVRIIVPFPPGGNTDGIARIIAQRLGETFGQQFVVENRAGASGTVAAETVARAPADGYTLFMGSPSQIAIAPAMTKVAYDPMKDFAPISIIGTNPLVLVVHPGMPVGSVAEFVKYVREQPVKLAYAAAGVGSIVHLSTAMFLHRAGLEMTPVTYKGGAPALADVIAGHVPVYFPNLSEALPYATSGALRLLAVSSETRVPQLPDLPTLSESGYPGFKALTWNGLMAPAGTPRDIIEQIAKDVSRAVAAPALADRIAGFGVTPVGSSPEQFAAIMTADTAFWAQAVRIAGVQEK